jgi:hypothetical protein
VVAFLFLCALSFSSCGGAVDAWRVKAFSSSISDIDRTIASRTAASLNASEKRKLNSSFSRAISSAETDAQWLSLMKRARQASAVGDKGRWIAVAGRAVAARPRSDPVAAAAAQAYLRSGESAKAFALFGPALSADARPALWAEAFMAAHSGQGVASASALSATSEDYARLAEVSGEPKALLGAAVMALASHDKSAAAAWLRKAMAMGAQPRPELLWDCALYEELSLSSDIGIGSRDLALMGDAAWLSDRRDLAKRRWERSVALAPYRSWKSYEKLALASEGETGQSYWARLKSAFLSGPASSERDGAIGAYACFLAREGRESEALEILKRSASASTDRELPGKLAVLELAIRSASMPEGRIASQYEALAAVRPLDSEVMGATLRSLSQRGMYGEVAVLRDGAARRGLGLEYGWYYEAEVLAARGELSKAIDVIKAASDHGAEGLFALGSLYGALGDMKASADAYSKAAIATTGEERCAAYKALGSSLGSSGDGEGASRAYRAALAAWPDDAEAAMLARQSERKRR